MEGLERFIWKDKKDLFGRIRKIYLEGLERYSWEDQKDLFGRIRKIYERNQDYLSKVPYVCFGSDLSW